VGHLLIINPYTAYFRIPQLYLKFLVLTPGVERPGHEADHSHSSTAEVKNACSYTSTTLNTSSCLGIN
jgi:hypothetical protein